MATTIRELLTKIGVEVDDRQLDDLEKKIGTFKKSFGALAKYAAGVTAALGGTVVTSALAGNAAAKSADRVGVLVERYQELQFAAKQAGASEEQFEGALRFGNVQLAEAAKGSETALERFRELGIEARDSSGKLKTIDEVLIDVAESLQGVEDPALVAAKAARIFGEEAGPRLVPLLKQGASGIALLSARAREFGGVISEDAARQSEAFFDRLDDLKTIAFGLRNAFTAKLLPSINRFLESLVRIQVESRAVVAAKLEAWADRLAHGLGVLRRILVNVNRAIAAFGASATWIDVLATSITALGVALTASTLIAGAAALKALFVLISSIGVKAILSWVAAQALLLAQIAIVVGAFVLAGLAIDDFLTFVRGGDSVIGRFLESIGLADDARAVLVAFGKEARKAIQPLFDLLGDLFAADADSAGFGANMITGLKELKPLIESTVSGLVELLRLYTEWQERIDLGGVTEAERDARNERNDSAAISVALERRAAREGVTVEELQARRAGQAGMTDAERRAARAAGSSSSSSSSSVDRSRHVSQGDTTITINGGGGDAALEAQRIMEAQARVIREDLAVGGEA